MSEPITLAVLAKAAPVLSVAKLADAAGMPAQTLHTRLRRGTPELNENEARAVAAAMERVGVAFTVATG